MARSKIKHFKGFSVVDGDIRVKLDMHRFEEQFRRAQYQLDGAVMNSMVPFMPMITGSFINTTRAASAAIQGSGEVYAAYGPQGRFLYEGKTMVSPSTGSTYAKNGRKESTCQSVWRENKGQGAADLYKTGTSQSAIPLV